MTVVSTQSTANLTVTQGLLQIESDYLGVDEQRFPGQGLSVYPNPASNVLHIAPALGATGKLQLKLFDLQGRLVKTKAVHLQKGLEKQKLDLSAFQEGTYLLKVDFSHTQKTYHQTYKIIKHSK